MALPVTTADTNTDGMTTSATTLDPASIEELLHAAMLAPSMHNTQPWRFAVSGARIDVSLDRHRLLPAEDPSGRAAYIAIGAALLNIRACAAARGLAVTLELSPDPLRWDLAASVEVYNGGSVHPSLALLAPHIPHRHTVRRPFVPRRVPEWVVAAASAAAHHEGATLAWLGPAARTRLAWLAGQADVLDSLDDARTGERASWVGGGERPTGDGVPSAALGLRPVDRRSLVRDLGVTAADHARASAVFEKDPLVGVLATTHDRPQDWLVAGMALQRTLLTLTRHDLAASFLNNPLERYDLRREVAELITPAGFPQMVLRVGYASATTSTPRRPLADATERGAITATTQDKR